MNSWRQFSLRTFLFAVLLLSIGLAWIAAERRRTAAANTAVAFFEERDALLIEKADWLPRAPWTRTILGSNEASRFEHAILPENFRDPDLPRLHDLPRLRWLSLHEGITDQGISNLRGHPGLESIYVDGSKVTDDGLIHFRSMPNLRGLLLWRTPLTGAGFIHLRGLKLVLLDICQSPLEDQYLQHLRELPALEKLDLGDTPITDKGLLHLHPIQTLRRVNLTMCPVTEKGVDELLAANPKLIVLDRFRPRGTRVITY